MSVEAAEHFVVCEEKVNLMMPATQSLQSNYQIGKKTISLGAFGQVKLGRNKMTKREKLVKLIDFALVVDAEESMNEVKILKNLNHENIIKLEDSIHQSHLLMIVMEHFNGHTLTQFLNRRRICILQAKISEHLLRDFFQQMTAAVGFLHDDRHKIAHRNLSLESFLKSDDSNRIKLINFDLATSSVSRLTKICGNARTASPQMTINEDYDPQKNDIWSLGALLYTLYTKKWPFKMKTFADWKLVSNSLSVVKLPADLKCSREMYDVLEKMLNYDEKDRINIRQIRHHVWSVMGSSKNSLRFEYEKHLLLSSNADDD